MKKQTLIITVLLVCSNLLFAQKAPYNVIMDMTSDDTITQKMGLRWISEIVDNNPDAKVEMVFYGKGLGMITQGKSIVADGVKKYAENKNVSLKVCAIAMKNNNVDKSQLIAGVQTVPDGIYEVISKQHDGWGYIKVSH
jgi:intracellular sulfur oxidation DsrE/DsrF family protein